MAIENRLNRRNSTELRDVKGVNYDVEKIKKGLTVRSNSFRSRE